MLLEENIKEYNDERFVKWNQSTDGPKVSELKAFGNATGNISSP